VFGEGGHSNKNNIKTGLLTRVHIEPNIDRTPVQLKKYPFYIFHLEKRQRRRIANSTCAPEKVPFCGLL